MDYAKMTIILVVLVFLSNAETGTGQLKQPDSSHLSAAMAENTSIYCGLAEVGLTVTSRFFELENKAEFGLANGLFVAYYFYKNQSLQPFLSYQYGLINYEQVAFLHTGLKYGLISSPHRNHIYISIGCAYQRTWINETETVYYYYYNNVGTREKRCSYNGFLIPIEMGYKIVSPNKRGVFSIGHTYEVARHKNATFFGYGIVMAISGYNKSLSLKHSPR